MTKFWKQMNILYERLLLIVLVLILLIVLWCMYDNYYVFSHTSDRISGYRPGTAAAEEAAGEKQISSDMVAWLTVDDTNIDYPIMQGLDNVRYLNTDPFGDYSLAGSIFLDSRCPPDFTGDYSLIYGHHMEYGRMFGALDDFLDEKYLRSHTTGELSVGREGQQVYKLHIFAAAKTNAQDDDVFDPGKGTVSDFITNNSTVNIDIENIRSGKRIVGLSTCTEGDSSARIIVFCYLDE